MFVPQGEPELVELPMWVRPPTANPHRSENPKRARQFAEMISRLPFLDGVNLFDSEDDDKEMLDQAIGFRRAGRQGLYVAYLVYLGLKRDPLACLLLAGMVAQTTKQDYAEPVRSRRRLYWRAVGWLAAIPHYDFVEAFGVDSYKLLQFRTTVQDDATDPDSSLLRRLDLNEGKVAVVKSPIRKFRSDATNSERYKDLHEPISLAGNLDANRAAELLRALRDEYPWAGDLLNDIETTITLSVSSGRRWLAIPPILIVGPPGIGKTRLIRRLSALSGVPYVTVGAAGLNDNRSFAGTSRGWGSAHPSRIVEIFVETKVANPIVLVDELEKAGGSDSNGRIAQSLLPMLEPETKGQFYDDALATTVDLSFVNWIFTANSLKELGRPLLSRLRIVHMPAPPASCAPKILKTALRELGERYGWTEEMLPTLDSTITAALQASMAKGASPRALVAMLEQVLAIEAKRRRASLN